MGWVVASFIVLTTCGVAEQDPAVAMVYEFEGTVEVCHSGDSGWQDVQKALLLAEGDRIRTGKSSNVTLLFSDNHSESIGEKQKYTVREEADKKQQAPSELGVVACLRRFFSRREDLGSRAAVRGAADARAAAIIPLAPGGGALVDAGFELRWEGGKDIKEFRVGIVNAAGNVVWEANTKDRHISVSADPSPLKPGNVYCWGVCPARKLPERALRTALGPFRVMTDDEALEIREGAQKVREEASDDLAPDLMHTKLVLYHGDRGLDIEALRELDEAFGPSSKDAVCELLQNMVYARNRLLNVEFERVPGGGDDPEAIAGQVPVVRSGDSLRARVSVLGECYVYAARVSPTGTVRWVYPGPAGEPAKSSGPGVTLEVPLDCAGLPVDDGPGRHTVVVMAACRPIGDLEQTAQALVQWSDLPAVFPRALGGSVAETHVLAVNCE